MKCFIGVLAVGILVLGCVFAPPTHAYIEVPRTSLRDLCHHSNYILVVRIEKIHAEKNIFLCRKVRDLRGEYPADVIKLSNGGHDTRFPDNMVRLDQTALLPGERRAILQSAEVGKTGLFFVRRFDSVQLSTSHLYIDDQWYAYSSASGNDRWEWWYLLLCESHLRKIFYGNTDRLIDAADAEAKIQAGKAPGVDPVVTCLADNSAVDIQRQPLDLRLGRAKVQRLRASGQKADGRDPREAAALARKLGDADLGIRLKAATDLADFLGAELKDAIPALGQAVKDKDTAVRRAVVRALRMAGDDKALIPPLVEAVKDQDAGVRRKAVEALSALGPVAKEAVPALLETLKHRDDNVVASAVEALSLIDPQIEAKSPAVGEALQKTAGINGKYRKLLLKIKVPNDLNRYCYFQDIGLRNPIPEYQGHKNLPKGYWVYAYPYWFIWGEQPPAR